MGGIDKRDTAPRSGGTIPHSSLRKSHPPLGKAHESSVHDSREKMGDIAKRDTGPVRRLFGTSPIIMHG